MVLLIQLFVSLQPPAYWLNRLSVNDTKLKVDVNVASLVLVEGSATRQRKYESTPWVYNGRYVGKDGVFSVDQGISIPFVGYGHSFDTKGFGYNEVSIFY